MAAALCAGLLFTACGSSDTASIEAAADVRNMTGAHTRVVWVQSDGTDPRAAGDDLLLMGFDTDDGQGERPILDRPASYVKPMLTPSGARIVFSRRPTLPDGPVALSVNWDGTDLRRLARGFALDVWRDPADGAEWVYVGTDSNPDQPYEFHTVTRHRLDDPLVSEPVWTQSFVAADTFQVSADGRRAAGLFPWPDAGVADLVHNTRERLGHGCWPALAPADVPLFWYFDGAHRNLLIVDLDTRRRWTVNLAGAPGFEGAEVFNPRWTAHPRFVTFTGPYNQGGPNQARTGGPQTEVWIGRFSADYTRIEAWTQVTRNVRGDSYPDVWIAEGQSPHIPLPRGVLGPPVTSDQPVSTGPDARRAVVQARLVEAGPIPTPESILPYRNALVVNTYEVVTTIDGSYDQDRILVAQWAIRDGRVLPDARKETGAEFALVVERYDARPELEGERLIQQGTDPALPLYYDLGP